MSNDDVWELYHSKTGRVGGFSIEFMPDLWDVGHSPAQIPSYLQLVSSIVKKAMLVSVVVVAPNSMNRQW